jgi:hypothetical protein
MLDPVARTATEVATIDIRGPTEPGYPYESVSRSRDGRVVLLTVVVSGTESWVFLIRPESAEVRPLVERAPARNGIVSPDGIRFAIGRSDPDPALAGLWLGTTVDGSIRRLVADDPSFAGSPPVPFAFSPDGSQIAFGVGLGEIGYYVAIVPVSSPELRIERAPATSLVGATLLGPASGAEFLSGQELFVWSSRSFFGGTTVAYSYDLTTKQIAELYRPELVSDTAISQAAWRPGMAAFATIERPMCCGINLQGTTWLRGRDKSARKLGDAGSFVGEMWWSRDGSRLYALVGGDDSVGGVIDLLTGGASVMSFCRRGGTPGRCT